MQTKSTQDQLEYLGDELGRLEQKMLSAETIKDAVAAGVHQAVSSPEFWTAGLNAKGARTKSAAGGFLLEGVWGTVRRMAWFIVAGFAVYLIGGWSGLVTLFKTVFGVNAH